jgi:hypothetical protein
MQYYRFFLFKYLFYSVGKGDRPQQSYRWTGCTARIVVSICKESVVLGDPKLFIKLHETMHNHPIGETGYYMFGENRSEHFDDSIEEVSRLVEARASFRKIHQFVRKKAGT